MSILLDALKKSEDQRQLGKTPTLHSSMGSEEPSAGVNRIWIPATMLLLTAGVIAWIGIEQFHPPESIAQAPVPILDVSQQVVQADSQVLEQANDAKRSARTPVMDYAAASPSSVSQTLPGTNPKPAATPKVNVLTRDMESNSPDQRPAAAALTTEESLAVTPVTVSPPREGQIGAAGRGQKRTDRLEPFVGDSISYWQVPKSVRDDIPQLRITVLVYAEKPEDRFLLINGQRLREKEDFGNGLVLEEIQRDRAIFNFRSYRFHLRN